MFIQQWIAHDGILMDHSSQQLLHTPFVTWFLYPWKVTQCLHLLLKLSRISHLQREKSGKDCGWWVIDELDQFIPWYIHIRLHKGRWTSYWEFCIVSCVLTLFETLELNVFETYKECAINKASVFLSSSDKSSQIPLPVTYSIEVPSFCIISPKHTDAFVHLPTR